MTAIFAAHTFADAWQYDASSHWKACTCGAHSEQAAHAGGTASCTQKAVCSICGQPYGEVLAHSLTYNEAVTATCTAAGHIAFWQCGACQMSFADDKGETVLASTTIPATGHTLTYQAHVAPTVSTSGVEAHYLCDSCNKLFLDTAAQQETTAAALEIPKLEQPVIVAPQTHVKIVDPLYGNIMVSSKHPAVGSTVTIALMPDTGFMVETVTVTDQYGRDIAVEAQSDGSYVFVQPRGTVTVAVTFVKRGEAPTATLPFSDVREGDWYYDAVSEVYEQGLMTGVTSDRFSPEIAVTRAMSVSILHRMAESPVAKGTPFADVSAEDWYAQPVAWAASQGITSGTGKGCFSPNATLTREQLAALLYNYSTLSGCDMQTHPDLSAFSDMESISPWATEAVAWAHAKGLLTGVDATTLHPQGAATRAQMAAMLVRYSSLLNERA